MIQDRVHYALYTWHQRMSKVEYVRTYVVDFIANNDDIISGNLLDC